MLVSLTIFLHDFGNIEQSERLPVSLPVTILMSWFIMNHLIPLLMLSSEKSTLGKNPEMEGRPN
jgi:hypothetical protein